MFVEHTGILHQSIIQIQTSLTFKPQHSPYPFQQPQYGQPTQYAKKPPDPKLCKLNPVQLQRLQELTGTFRWYADAIDSTYIEGVPIFVIKRVCLFQICVRIYVDCNSLVALPFLLCTSTVELISPVSDL